MVDTNLITTGGDTIQDKPAGTKPVQAADQVLPPEPPVVPLASTIEQRKVDLAFQPETIEEATTDEQVNEFVQKQGEDAFNKMQKEPLSSIVDIQEGAFQEAKKQRTETEATLRGLTLDLARARAEKEADIAGVDPKMGVAGLETKAFAERRFNQKLRQLTVQQQLLENQIEAEKAFESEQDPLQKVKRQRELEKLKGAQTVIDRFSEKGVNLSIDAAQKLWESEQRYVSGDIKKGEEMKAYNNMLDNGVIESGDELESATNIADGNLENGYAMITAGGVGQKEAQKQLKESLIARGMTTEEAQAKIDDMNTQQTIDKMFERISAGEDIPDEEFNFVSNKLEAKGLQGDEKSRDSLLSLSYKRAFPEASTRQIETFIREQTQNPNYKFSQMSGRTVRTDDFGGFKIIIDKPKPVSLQPLVDRLRKNPYMFTQLSQKQKDAVISAGFDVTNTAEPSEKEWIAALRANPHMFEKLNKAEQGKAMKAGFIPSKEGVFDMNKWVSTLNANPQIFLKLGQKEKDEALKAGYVPAKEVKPSDEWIKSLTPASFGKLSPTAKTEAIKKGYIVAEEVQFDTKEWIKTLSKNPHMFERLTPTAQTDALKNGLILKKKAEVKDNDEWVKKLTPASFEKLNGAAKTDAIKKGYVVTPEAEKEKEPEVSEEWLQTLRDNPYMFEKLGQASQDEAMKAGYLPSVTIESDPLKAALSEKARKLDPQQVINGKTLSNKLFGKLGGKDPENYIPILNMLAEGKTIDNISDDVRSSMQSSEYQGDFRTATSRVGLNMTGTKGDELANEVDRLLETGSVETAKNTLLQGVRTSLKATPQAQYDGRKAAIRDMRAIGDLFSQYVALNGDTGLIEGTKEEAYQKIFKKTGNPRLANIGSQITVALQTYRQSKTGAQFSVQEAEEYAKQFPDTAAADKLNQTKVNALISAFERNQESTVRGVVGDDMYETIFKGINPALSSATGVKTTQTNPTTGFVDPALDAQADKQENQSIAEILTSNGYEATPENIAIYKQNN